MALSLAKAAPLKPEIRLAQVLSEFESNLSDDEKVKLRNYRGQSPPSSADVMRLTAEIDRDASRNRKSRQCVGPRLTNILHGVQQFSTVVDLIVGSSQSQIAGAIWGTVRISLQLASTVSSYFDQLSTLLMRIGCTCPRHQDIEILYPESERLQSALCEYFVVFVRLCNQAVLFLKKPFWSQLSSSIIKPFESEFGRFQQDLEILASSIRDEVSLASSQAQQNETKEMSRFRAFATRDIGKTRRSKRKKVEFRFLNACSVYDHEKSWKQARKQGHTNWICHDERYKQWKEEKVSSTLWCTGILGSGKTVLSANVVEDLKITTQAAVAYFFCRHDEAESLEPRTIIGSIARQIFDHTKSDIKSEILDAIVESRSGIIDTDQILDYLQELLPSTSHGYFIIIDGLDECEEKNIRSLLQGLKQLLVSKHIFQVYCSSRSDVFRWAQRILEPRWTVSMSKVATDIEEYVQDTLMKHLESGNLSIGDPTIILTIQDTLLNSAHGMFLWVVFQIDSICSQKTDKDILTALKDLPKDLPETFNRILQKLQHSNDADPRFCKKIFLLMAAAQRPLTLDELREAISVEPGKISWDASNLVNDMLRLLLESCGSLIAVDEEHSTLHFTHHSVKQYILSEPVDSKMKSYHVNTIEADVYLGDIIVTYLNFEVFDRQLAKTKTTMLPQMKIDTSAILGGSLPRSTLTNLAMRFLKSRRKPELDIHSQLKTAAGIVEDESKKQPQPAHPFLPYAQMYWLFHTKGFNSVRASGYTLWEKLFNEGIKMIELPWAPKKWNEFGDKYMTWIMQNEHWALIDRSLNEFVFVKDASHSIAAKLLLEFLERKETDMNAQNTNFEITLYLASCLNNKAIVLLSIRKGVDVNAKIRNYGPALQVASLSGCKEIVGILLANGANVNTMSGEYGTALQAASVNGYEEIVLLLLNNRADVNAKGGFYGTALQAASKSGRKEIVGILLENGAKVNAMSGKYGTALQAASENGDKEIVRILLENGANVNAVSGKSDTALQIASQRGQKEIVEILLVHGANVDAEHEKYGTALQAASRSGQKEVVEILLTNGANVDAEGGYSGTALQAASKNGDKEIVEILLTNGVNVNAMSGKYCAALQAASIGGHKGIVILLLKNGANVDNEGGYYGTALQDASSSGQKEVVEILLTNGANVNVECGYYGTALQAASSRGYKEIVEVLLANGANVNAVSGCDGTALQAASENGHEDIAGLLLENGAISNKKMDAASNSGRKKV